MFGVFHNGIKNASRARLARPNPAFSQRHLLAARTSTSRYHSTSLPTSSASHTHAASEKSLPSNTGVALGADSLPENQPIGKAEPRLMIQFTCTVPDCNTRSSHEFSKRSYEKGIVIVECPGCKNRHLIADHLGWFKDSRTADGKFRTIEHIMKEKGEFVKRGKVTNGVISVNPES